MDIIKYYNEEFGKAFPVKYNCPEAWELQKKFDQTIRKKSTRKEVEER